jgi:hypothetical protein
MKSKILKCLSVMLIFGMMAATSVIAGESTIIGIVEKTDKGIVLSAADGAAYNVMGADLSGMVGKVVKATGTLEEGPSGKTFTIVSVEPTQK